MGISEVAGWDGKCWMHLGPLRGSAREEQLPAQRSPADQAGHRRSGATGVRRGVGVGDPYTQLGREGGGETFEQVLHFQPA